MNIKLTAGMENQLDQVELGKENWQQVVDIFYKDFKQNMEYASKQMGVSMPKPAPTPSDVKCDKCGAMMVYRDGKFGKFLACSNFPQCKNTKNVNQANHQVDDKGKCPNCGGVVSAKYSKRGKLFFGCDNYPKCDYASWYKPTGEKCPECNDLLVDKKGNRVYYFIGLFYLHEKCIISNFHEQYSNEYIRRYSKKKVIIFHFLFVFQI